MSKKLIIRGTSFFIIIKIVKLWSLMKLTIFFNQSEKKNSFPCLKETNVTLRSIKSAESTSSFDKNQTHISWRFVVKIMF